MFENGWVLPGSTKQATHWDQNSMSKRSVPFIGSQEQKAGKKCINFVWDQEVIHDVLFCKEGYMVGVWMITIQFGEYARWYKGLRCLLHESEGEAKGGGGVNDHHTILLENMHVGTANTR